MLGTVERYRLFGPATHILAAISGGADSTCLCRILAELSAVLNLRVSTMYVNHHLRPDENKREVEFCRELCGALAIGLFVEDAPADRHKRRGVNLQKEARNDRYALLEQRRHAIGADLIALGHTKDDQAETMIMRFIRGSGSRGLSGIPVKRGRIVRPLLDVRRQDVDSYLRLQGQQWCEDSSNRSGAYQRNRIRRQFMPLVEKENPGIVDTLARNARVFSEEEEYLTGEARRILKNLVATGSAAAIELDGKAFDHVPIVLRRRIVRMVAEDLADGYGAGILHTDQVLSTLASGGKALFPNGVTVERSGNAIRFASPAYGARDRGFETTLEVPGSVALPDGTTLSAMIAPFDGDCGDGKRKAVFDSGTIRFPLKVRSRHRGDRIRPFGLGGWKKVQDILVDAKVPRFRRDEVPVVTNAEGEIIWIAGFSIDERFGLRKQAQSVLVLTVGG